MRFFTKTNNVQDDLINLPRCEATNVVFIIVIDISDNGYEQRKSFFILG
jgi:hypothetical protein